MFNRRLLVEQGGASEPPLPTEKTVLWRGYSETVFYITIPDRVKVLEILTENAYVNGFVLPKLPRYVGVTPGKTYRFSGAYAQEGGIPEPEYWDVGVQRYTAVGNWKNWVDSYNGENPEGEYITDLDIIMYYSASINNIKPDITDY